MFVHLRKMCAWGSRYRTSRLEKSLSEEKADQDCGEIFGGQAKKANRNATLYSMGSSKISVIDEIALRVEMSKKPLKVGQTRELSVTLKYA